MLVELNVEEEWEFIDAREFIIHFGLEKLAKEIFKMPQDVSVADWKWYRELKLTDDEIIAKLLSYMEGKFFFMFVSEGDGYFKVFKLNGKHPIKLQEVNPSRRDM